MNRSRQLLTLAFSLLALSLSAQARPHKSSKPKRPRAPDLRYDKWEALEAPSQQQTQIYGRYASGCIAGAVALPIDGLNYSVVNLNEKRVYGHPDTLRFIRKLGAILHKRNIPQILVEDIGGPRGGPFRRGHASHQNGLDVDISFYLPHVCLTMGEREWRPEISFVDNHKTLKKNWTRDQTIMVVAAAASPEVDRVFVSPVIKKYLCQILPTEWWLYKVRAWWGHEDHMHVRLKCPKDQPNCQPQALDPKDTQCGPSLNEWMKKVASSPPSLPPARKPAPKVTTRAFPKLPAQCETVRKSN